MTTERSTQAFQGNVIIIGGGIGGPALALFLKKAGIQSTIYEAYLPGTRIGGGFGLAPNGMNVLAALGLAEKTKARSALACENIFYNDHGKILARFQNGNIEKYGQPGVSILRATLQDILLDEVKKQGIPIEFNKRLKNISMTDTKVTAHFEDGTVAEGNLLIGADGTYSQTRRLVLPDSPKPAYIGIVGIGGITPAAAVRGLTAREKQSFNFTYGPNGFFGYAAIENGDMMWWSNLPRAREMPREELTNVSLDTVKQEMLALYQHYHEPIPSLIANAHSPVKHNISDIQSLPTWHKGRVVLIGDAAHAVSPNVGQGASMALEDAMYLASLLRHSDNYEQAFAEFETGRRPRVEKIVAEGRRRGDDKQILSPLQSKIREIMMTIFINLFGKKGLDWLYSYKIAWE